MTTQELNALLSCFEGSSLTKLKLSTQEFTIELERGASTVPTAPAASPLAVSVPETPAGETVTAPMVGTFYAAPTPDQPPYVQVGDRVKKGDPLCLLEAMKMMSEVTAPCECIIEEVCVTNGQLVAFGQPLMRYRPC